MSSGKIIFAFSLGAAIGSVITWRVLKNKYEQIARTEIEEVKAVYSRREREKENVNEVDTNKNIDEEHESRVKKYGEIAKKYNPPEATETSQMQEDNFMADGPYVISPAEFGDQDEYDTVSLKYYSDGVLTDFFDEPVDDVDDLVGEESLKSFGEYEPDSVYVRNEEERTDYEILLEPGKFSDIKKHDRTPMMED